MRERKIEQGHQSHNGASIALFKTRVEEGGDQKFLVISYGNWAIECLY